MDLNEFLAAALQPTAGQRRGQAFMNTVFVLDPKIYGELVARGLDAFHEDAKVWPAVDWIVNNWKN